MRWTLALIALALAACGNKDPRRAPAGGTGDGGAAAAAIVDGGAPDAGIAVVPLDPAAPLPAGARRGAVRIAGVEFVDAAGTNRVFLLERRTRKPGAITIALDAFVVVIGPGGEMRELSHVKDLAERCGVEATRFLPAIGVTDVDADRTAEVAFAYAVGCGETTMTIKQLWLEGGARHVLRGTSAADAVPDPAPDQWPDRFFEAASAAYAAAADELVGAAAAGGDRVSAGNDFELVDRNATVGDVELEISYPRLAGMIPNAAATELTRRMREFLRSEDTGWARGRTGSYWASCEVGLSTPEVISIECERLDATLTPADQRAGTGGVEAEPTRLALATWLDGSAMTAVDPAELVGDIRNLVIACGPLAGLVALRREGVVALGDDAHQRPESCEPLAWDDTRPTTARAKRLVGRLTAEP